MRDRLRRRLQGWMRPRRRESLPVGLTRDRIYVLPTPTGLFFGVLLGAMLLGALNFNNNPALLLALLLGGAALASLIAAHLQLSGLRVEAMAAEPVAAGKPLRLKIALAAGDGRTRRGLRIAHGDEAAHAAVSVQGGGIELPLPTAHRGLMPLPRIELSTVQPLGLAKAWAYVWPEQALLVYPAPEAQAPPLPLPAGGQGQPQPLRTGDDPHHLRGYQPGDAPRSVAWKASARRDSLIVREYEQQRSGELRLEWAHTTGLPYEQRIRRLARWIDHAEREGRRYALALPGQPEIPLGQGAAHRHRCLRALALLPGGGADG